MNLMFKKLIGKKHYSSKNYYRHESLDRYSGLSAYVKLMDEISNKNPKKIEKKIEFSKDIPFEQINKNYIIRRYGKPKYKLANKSGLFKREVYFYKVLLAGHKTRFNVHFVNNSLIYYSYTFSNINKMDKEEIMNALKNKYLNGNELNSTKVYLLDKNNCAINVVDNLGITVHYICNLASDFFQNLDPMDANEKTHLKSKKQKDLFQSL